MNLMTDRPTAIYLMDRVCVCVPIVAVPTTTLYNILSFCSIGTRFVLCDWNRELNSRPSNVRSHHLRVKSAPHINRRDAVLSAVYARSELFRLLFPAGPCIRGVGQE